MSNENTDHECARCRQTPTTVIPEFGPDPLCGDCVTSLCVERAGHRPATPLTGAEMDVLGW